MKELDQSAIGSKERKLIDVAISVQQNAYAPYSKYFVGAAVSDETGQVYGGCNVENAAYTGTHAEASAIAQLVAQGGKKISQLVCVTQDGGSPCGDCRQRIWEFSHGDKATQIFLVDKDKRVWETTIGELLPYAFELDS